MSTPYVPPVEYGIPVAVPEVPIKTEKLLRAQLAERAKERCRPITEEYVNCCKHRTVTLVFACKKYLVELNKCMGRYTNEDELTRLKIEWVKQRREELKQQSQ